MADSHLIGKLAVILHADIVGSTELVQLDEQKAHRRVQDSFQRFAGIISGYGGQVRELRGDALLAEFERASDAVTAALAFQSSQAEYNAQLDDDLRPLARVGIAMGEVVIADATITGAGVVLAQRLEQLADAGGLCITPAIREALPRRLPFKLENLGEREVKGFDEPVGVYRVSLEMDAILPAPLQRTPVARPRNRARWLLIALAALVLGVGLLVPGLVKKDEPLQPEPAVQSTPADQPSIAVLPFDNLSGDPEQEYFADGISEDLTTDLSRISGLFVVARNSSFAYKGQATDLRTVAAELGVRYVLEGSVRRVGDQIRINAQLIDGTTGGHLWADRFDGTLADVFKLQDEVNRHIVSALEVRLTVADEQRLERVETRIPEAYDQMLRGIEEYNRFTAENVVNSRVFFERAAQLDPDYARAYANIALTYATAVNFQWTGDREEAIRLGLEFADRAMALDDGIPQIYLTRSVLYLSQRQHDKALRAARQTLEVHPNNADGQATMGFIQSYAGELEGALESMERARRINPQGTGVYLALEGRTLFLLGRYEDAIQVLQQALERNPAFERIHLHLAAAQAQLGRMADAAWSLEEALSIRPDLSISLERQGSLYRDERDLERVLDALRKAGLRE